MLCVCARVSVGGSTGVVASAPPASVHSRPFYLSSCGRNKTHKGQFSVFEYEPQGGDDAGPKAAFGRTAPLPGQQQQQQKRRTVDIHGAPLQAHRGVTSLRARSFPTGTVGTGVPAGNSTMAYTKEREWHPAAYTPGMAVHEHFRMRFEGLAGVQRKHAAVQSLHGPAPFAHGAHTHHALFDPTVRPLERDDSAAPTREQTATRAAVAAARVAHPRPFKGGATVPVGVGADRSFVSGHAQLPYHYSEYSLSEKSLSEPTSTSLGPVTGPGFRERCAHHIHSPFKATTARHSRRGGETSRDPNLHAIQAPDERCHHRCNEVLAHARIAAAAPTHFTSRF